MKFVTNKIKKIFCWSLGVICAICICDMAYHYIRLHKYNQSPLNIETFDGSNSPYHPSVLYSSDGWGEYHYIMSDGGNFKFADKAGMPNPMYMDLYNGTMYVVLQDPFKN